MQENNTPQRIGNAPQNPKEWKIFPRNLTARAAYIVPGNPTSTRPEDGVDNCYPGLEMDIKNLQKYFFPGLYFDVYRPDGARLIELTPPDRAQQWLTLGLQESDLNDNLYLWALKGKTTKDEDDGNPPVIDFVDVQTQRGKLGGLYIWRKINALFPGKIAVVIGPHPPVKDSPDLTAALAALETAWQANQAGVIERQGTTLKFAILIKERADYLTEQGVIDPDVYQSGELTRTLCTPWTYDFRDCQCFYWASNKPDVNSSEDGTYPYLNFQRKNWQVNPQTQDIANDYPARRQQEIDYAEMMIDWEQLRPVVNGKECGQSYKPEKPPSGPLLTLDQIKTELTYLATVEHALAVQYLYAYYSIDAPEQEPQDPDLRTFRLWKGANEIFNIAIDEMRHLRWANEVLRLLGEPPTIKRAAKLGRRFQIPFYLQSLTSTQLQWFVDVERPSRSTLMGLDGMYVGIQVSLQNLSAAELTEANITPENLQRAVEIVKLIIDEGEGHYVRFSTAQQNLAFFDHAGREILPSYIRKGQWSQKSDKPDPELPGKDLYGIPQAEPTSTEIGKLQDQSDSFYQTLVIFLLIAFSMQDAQIGGQALYRAISLMFQMNAVNFDLATGKVTASSERLPATPLFTLPQWLVDYPPIKSRQAAQKLLDQAKSRLKKSGILSDITRTGIGADMVQRTPLGESKTLPSKVLQKTLKSAHDTSVEDVIAYFEQAIEETEF